MEPEFYRDESLWYEPERPNRFGRREQNENVSSILPIRPLDGSNSKLPDGVPLDQNTQFFGWSILRSLEHYDISICSVRFIDMMFLDLGLLIGFDPK